MPVVVITSSKATPTKVRKYIMQKEKTNDDLKFSSFCEADSFDKDFETVQKAYNCCQKKDSRKYYHIKLSWATRDDVTAQQAKEVAVRFCEESNIKGCQYAGSIHADTRTIHAHIVVNNVRVEDNEYGKAGYSYQATKQSRKLMMDKANEIAKEYGLLHSVINPEREIEERFTKEELKIRDKGEKSWKDMLREQIKDAKEHTNSFQEFKEYLRSEHGVAITENKKGNLRYFPNGTEGGERGCPAKRLGESYDREELECEFDERNREYERGWS